AALDVANSPETRRAALHQLVEAHPHDVQITLRKLLDDKDTAGAAARGLLLQNDPQIPEEVLKRWSLFDSEDRNAIVGLFATRASFASALLDAIGRGEIPRTALNVPGAQQILDLHRPELAEKLAKVWGTIHSSNAEKLQTMARYRQMLTPEVLKNADLSHGRAIFQQVCALCHKLYGQGASIGPDLTGGGRADLEYLLQNVVDPSAIVPASYQVIQLELKDDRSVSGLVVEKTETTITMQTPTQKLVIPKSDIASTHQSALSLMPEGLLQSMKDDQVRDLLAYLMAPHQVPLAH
ncbi:MAG TPA: c-type cytochrome, partial [Verrucomicrobiae bacterium]|nr:c-type cytochrome [Verrucomicrobiae bacterium]